MNSLKRTVIIAVGIIAVISVALVAFFLITRGPNIEVWVAKAAFGPPATQFSTTDGIYPVVYSSADLDQRVKVSLIDADSKTLTEKTYNVRGPGGNGYGDYNQGRNLTPGSYRVEFWSDYDWDGDTLLKTIQITVE